MRSPAGGDASRGDVWVHRHCHPVWGSREGLGAGSGAWQLAPSLPDCTMDPVPCVLFRCLSASFPVTLCQTAVHTMSSRGASCSAGIHLSSNDTLHCEQETIIACLAGLHFTYPRDKRHAAQEARALSEAAREATAGVGLARSSSWSALTSTGDNEESELLVKDKRNRRLL